MQIATLVGSQVIVQRIGLDGLDERVVSYLAVLEPFRASSFR